MSVYQSTFLQPRNVAIDASVDNIFSCIVQGGTIDKYRLRIYDNSDNSLDYDSTEVVLGTPLYGGETLNILLLALSLSNNKEYKWNIETFEGASSAISSFALFRTNTPPVVTFNVPSTIPSQSYTFEATYTQAEGVALAYTQFIFYDNANNIIRTTDRNYTGRIQYEFDGFVDNSTYSVQIIGYTSNGVYFQTAKYVFTVDYPQPNALFELNITQDSNTSLVNIEWAGATQITGTPTGTYSFVDGCIYDGSKALQLEASAKVLYGISVPFNFTTKIKWRPSDYLYDGKIADLNGDNLYEVGYSGGRFYALYQGQYFYSQYIALDCICGENTVVGDYLITQELASVYKVYIFIEPFGVYIKINDSIFTIDILL